MEIDSIDDLDTNNRYSSGISQPITSDPYALNGRSAMLTPPSLANKVSRLACAIGGRGGRADVEFDVTLKWGDGEVKADFKGRFDYSDHNGNRAGISVNRPHQGDIEYGLHGKQHWDLDGDRGFPELNLKRD